MLLPSLLLELIFWRRKKVGKFRKKQTIWIIKIRLLVFFLPFKNIFRRASISGHTFTPRTCENGNSVSRTRGSRLVGAFSSFSGSGRRKGPGENWILGVGMKFQ